MKHLTVLLAFAVLTGCGSGTGVEPQAITDVPSIHKQALVIDAHADIEIPGKYSAYVGDDGLSQIAPEKMRQGNVDAAVMAIGVSLVPRTAEGYQAARARADEELNAVLELTRRNEDFVLARSPDELTAAQKESQHALILGFQNAAILAKDVNRIDAFFDQGVRVFALTHLGHNTFADSSRPDFVKETGKHEPEAEHGGLSELGREAVRRVNALGAVLDVSQLSKQATLEMVELSQAPVIASHSNVRALTDVTRNLSDEEIDAIAAKGGVVHVSPFRGYLYDSNDEALDANIRAARREAGITEDYYYPFELYWEIEDKDVKNKFVGAISSLMGAGSIDALVGHIDYIAKRVGVDHVGFGSDYNHGGGIAELKDASEAQNLTSHLLERGYSETDINKFWGGNFLRVWRQARRKL
ncbi:MAG: dipeptidase [Pseudomonadales bacterium]